MNQLIIELPFVGPSPNKRVHWAVNAKYVRNCKWWVRSKSPRLLLPKARITYLRVGRKMDADNLGMSFKAIQDGLKGWVIQDDSPDEIEVTYAQRKPEKGERPHSVITVEYDIVHRVDSCSDLDG